MTKRKTETVVEKKAAPKRVKASASAAAAADVDMAPAAPAARKIVFAVGSGDMSQLGLGPEHQERKRFTTVFALKDKPATAIACGAMHNLALLQDGSVQSWGCNDEGAIGRSTDEWLPEPIPALKGIAVTQVAAGSSHSLALTQDGTVFAWGTYKQNSGALGFSKDVMKQETPVTMTQLQDKKITQVSAGENHVLALTDTGKIYQWGDIRLGLRQSERVQKAKLNPTLVNIREKVVKIFATGYSNFAVTAKKHVWGWGLNNYGQLGTGNYDEVKAPIRLPLVEALGDISQIVGATHHTLILNAAGHVYAVGRGHYGRLGLGNQDDQKQPAQIPSLQWPNERVTAIAAGDSHSMAVTSKGRLFSWGYGDLLQLGNGIEQDEVAPIEVPNVKGVIAASGGAQHSLIIADERPKSDKSDKADAPAVAPPAVDE